MDFSQLIQQELPRMTKTEHAVASYFDSHMQEFAFSTLEAIADSAGTSTTSVIRFCRRLGFSGYKEFQRSLQEAVRVQLDLPDKVERTIRFSVQDSLLQQVIQDGLGNVERTFQDLSPEALSGAAERISRAGRVFTYGLRESLALAHYAMTRFIPLRDRVQLLDVGYNGFWESLLDLNSRDVVIYFLFHRYTAQSRRILPLLKEQGAQVILITSPPYHNILRNKAKGTRNNNGKNYRMSARDGVEYYSENNNDLGNFEEYADFLDAFKSIMAKAYRKLRNKKYATVIISDFTINKKEVCVQADIVRLMQEIGFTFAGTTVLIQPVKPLYPFGYPYAYKINHHHQNLITFRKSEDE